ncbi:hypothetical protein HMPREF0663_11042 [Hoylesella oralis ATCC 33269]|jgi:hypothetical protein|uniref:Uncharacterized protein n=1 Tax=Hoylesella oralis ATCC 33269 TaxID=873533 RepID=E7RPE1_9BACT|nr:hypothetical protein HMPREF0663_11042 [Hoylesella oralis ATCC 33269]
MRHLFRTGSTCILIKGTNYRRYQPHRAAAYRDNIAFEKEKYARQAKRTKKKKKTDDGKNIKKKEVYGIASFLRRSSFSIFYI